MLKDSLFNKIRSILEKAVHAPSGDNAQPWRFKVEGNKVLIFNVAGKDATLYNFKERGSIFAHGALLENISIVAGSHGLSAQIHMFPDVKNENCTAEVIFNDAERIKDSLEDFIMERATNRKPYKKVPLSENHRKELLASIESFQFGEIRLQEERDNISHLAKNISLNERLILECKPIHDFLFGIISWSKKEEEERGGLYIKTLEFSPPQQALFHKLKSWKLASFFSSIGFPKLVARQSAGLYASSAAIGALLIPNDSKESFLMAGRIFQRFWLTATKIGLRIQPITAIPYLAQRIKAGEGQELSSIHKGLIINAYAEIAKTFGINEQTTAMLFRIGYGDPPSAKSAKLPPKM